MLGLGLGQILCGEFVSLLRECLCKYTKRITTMTSVVRLLADLESRFCNKTHEKELMVKKMTEYYAKLEAKEIQKAVNLRVVVEQKCKYCFLDSKLPWQPCSTRQQQARWQAILLWNGQLIQRSPWFSPLKVIQQLPA